MSRRSMIALHRPKISMERARSQGTVRWAHGFRARAALDAVPRSILLPGKETTVSFRAFPAGIPRVKGAGAPLRVLRAASLSPRRAYSSHYQKFQVLLTTILTISGFALEKSTTPVSASVDSILTTRN